MYFVWKKSIQKCYSCLVLGRRTKINLNFEINNKYKLCRYKTNRFKRFKKKYLKEDSLVKSKKLNIVSQTVTDR